MNPINDPAHSHLQTGNGGRLNIGVAQPSNGKPFLIESSLLLAIFALALAVAAWRWQLSHLCFDHISLVTCRPLKELTQQFTVSVNVTRWPWYCMLLSALQPVIWHSLCARQRLFRLIQLTNPVRATGRLPILLNFSRLFEAVFKLMETLD